MNMVKISRQGIIFQNGFVSFLLIVRWICYHLKTATLVLTEYISLRKKGTSVLKSDINKEGESYIAFQATEITDNLQ